MTKVISELTYKIVAYTEIQEVDTNESIDWAIEMMELGFESPSLHMLYWAWDDLNYEDSECNYYWKGARKANIEMIVIDEANKWIEKNKKHYVQ